MLKTHNGIFIRLDKTPQCDNVTVWLLQRPALRAMRMRCRNLK